MPSKSSNNRDKKRQFDPGAALLRLILVAGTGCLLILFYGFYYAQGKTAGFLSIVSVGIMAGGAALLSGGLVGFLFGVPHTKSDAGSSEEKPNGAESGKSPAPNPSSPYRPNTSLEQISDWLTKILVGVGLVQIKEIPGKFAGLAAYVGKGLGGGAQAEAFALALLVYFSVCGFVFGFLWARLYLPKWFREADEVQALGEKIDRLEKQRQADARALLMVQQLLNPHPDDPPIPQEDVFNSIKSASQPAKAQIFTQAEKISDDRDVPDFDVKNEGAILIFRGLIAEDTDEIYHRNHYELSRALYHKKPPDLPEAVKEITKAIEIRDKLGKKGWKYQEFHLGRCLIEQIPVSQRDQPSDPKLKEQVLAALRAAQTQTDKWQKWRDGHETVRDWLAVNHIDPNTLQQS
jgi:hypothetical protein